ncbi:hypothetical protein BCR39DRAFT_523753 [Naematelia encephala]|uniref:S-adenosyl-L-methionine-dependent methyltransferase n=1 Tax=Naematelia encephala TaxID=71784 RepID=A0A1Y2BBS5_9TREE|nr:hypothetical protein BCR39DRAFT_523753 [Naematelia encephala]
MFIQVLAPITEIIGAWSIGLGPTLRAILSSPVKLLLHPSALKQFWFAKVWQVMGPGMDEGWGPTKRELVFPHVKGVVFEIGAGLGHSCKYFDLERVTKYIALEPDEEMHLELMTNALKAGLKEDQIVLIGCGLEDLRTIKEQIEPESIDTILSTFSLCSVPSLSIHLSTFVKTFLVPSGQLVFLEHVRNPRTIPAVLQKLYTPIWSIWFGGCKLDSDTINIVDSFGVWKEGRQVMAVGAPGGSGWEMFPHRLGIYLKA